LDPVAHSVCRAPAFDQERFSEGADTVCTSPRSKTRATSAS
jgi:hypothetical protein